MKLTDTDVKYISDLLTEINKTGVVCKQDVMSLESIVEGSTEGLNINGFTKMKTNTGIKDLKTSLETLIANYQYPVKKDIRQIFDKIEELKTSLDDVLEKFEDKVFEINTDLTNDILVNNLLTRINDNDERVNLIDLDISQIVEDDLNYIIKCISAYLEIDVENKVSKIINRVNSIYYSKPKDMFSMLRILLKNDVTFFNYDSAALEQVTLKDVISEYVIKDRFLFNIKNMDKEIKRLKVDLSFDKAYDSNMNNTNISFTYDHLYNRFANFESLLKDDISFIIVNLFKVLLSKSEDTE